MKLRVVDANGRDAGELEADDTVFGIEPNLAVVHQAVLAYRANQRQGTHNTLNRSDLRQANVKTRRQKGSGAARLGGPSSPTRKGGAVAHGPHPRSYRQRLPKKMRRLAIRSMLSQRAAEGGLVVTSEAVRFDGKTSGMSALCRGLGIERSGLFVSDGVDEELVRGSRNLSEATSTAAQTLNPYVLITHDQIVMTEAAVRRCEALWSLGGGASEAEPVEAGEEG